MSLLLAMAAILGGVKGFSSGPPVSIYFDLVCNRMTPNPSISFHGPPDTGNGGYLLEIDPPMGVITRGFAYTGGQQYTSKQRYS